MDEWVMEFPDWGEAFQQEYEEAAQTASSLFLTDQTGPDCKLLVHEVVDVVSQHAPRNTLEEVPLN